MALWKDGRWQALNEKTDYKTNYRADEFTNLFPADREVEKWISFKISDQPRDLGFNDLMREAGVNPGGKDGKRVTQKDYNDFVSKARSLGLRSLSSNLDKLARDAGVRRVDSVNDLTKIFNKHIKDKIRYNARTANQLVNGKKSGKDWVAFEIKDTTIDNYPKGYGLGILAETNGFVYGKNVQKAAQQLGNQLTENGRKNREEIQERFKYAYDKNEQNKKLNETNQALNTWSKGAIDKATAGPTGSYVRNRENIEEYGKAHLYKLVEDGRISKAQADTLLNAGQVSYKNYYTEKRVKPWDAKTQGLQPPVGGFDAGYYISDGNKGDDLNKKWRDAKNLDDLDILTRYGSKDNFAWNHYSTVGKQAGYRGNRAAGTEYADAYTENFESLTDAEKQFIREGQLGLKGSGGNYAIDWEDTTGSFLEGKVETTIGEETLKTQDRFSALTTDLLRTTVDQLKKANAEQRKFDLYSNLPGFSEIYNINSSLANTLLADSGLGGYLGMAGINTRQYQRKLEEDLSKYTGIDKGYATYDWNKWFDQTLTKRYEDMERIEGKLEAGKQYELDEDFRDSFIEDYIRPRFEGSKSMDEFMGYLSTTQDGANVYDVSDASNSLKNLASERAAQYYSSIKNLGSVGFNAGFYTNPDQSGVNDAKKERYRVQKNTFNSDWDKAKRNKNAKAGGTDRSWADWAYYYGVDINNKDQFARLHYDVIGRGKGFDPAKDVVTQGDVREYINKNVLTALANADVDWDGGEYLAFVTPEEFADSVIEGIDPEKNKTGFRELLDSFGLGEGTEIDAVKDYLTDAFSSGEAATIRESIAYLNQKKIKPTQKELGVTYIERDTDDKYREDPEADDLFNLFSKAGYGGTIEQFYNTFMPDEDRGSLQLISKARKDALALRSINTSDPFEALSDLNRIFGNEEEDIFGDTIKKPEEKERNYFDLFGSKEKEEEESKQTNKKSSFGFDTDTDYYSDMLSLFK